MKNLSKEKRQQLVLVALLTAGVVGGVWFGLIQAQKAQLRALADQKVAAQRQLEQVQRTIASGPQIETQLAGLSKRLAELEEGMATGDLNIWAFNTVRQFKADYKVEIPQFSQDGPKDASLLPHFPYKQVTLTLLGTAHYNDLGRFLAEFENQHPFSRVLNLSLEPAPVGNEKLQFRLEIAALVKPGVS